MHLTSKMHITQSGTCKKDTQVFHKTTHDSEKAWVKLPYTSHVGEFQKH